MSYYKVRSICISKTEGKVYITAASSNLYPRLFERFECKNLSNLLVTSGLEAVELELLKLYESGELHGGSNKYVRILKELRNMPEYQTFNWQVPDWVKFKKVQENRKTQAFEDLLKKALKH